MVVVGVEWHGRDGRDGVEDETEEHVEGAVGKDLGFVQFAEF